MGDLERLLVGPAARAAAVALQDHLTRHARNGGAMPDWAVPLMRELAIAADADLPHLPVVMSATGHANDTLAESSWVTVAVAADLAGCTERHARRLAAAGRVRARRLGERTWVIDIDSLKRVLRRTAA